jgi:signal transduction histidine kinase
MNLLIVEDDPTSRLLLRRALVKEGHQAAEAANGMEALQALEHAPVDAVISDILMPLMDGYRLCYEIRRSKKINSTVPVILYTATYDSPSDRQLAETAGADAYFLKPTPICVLLEAVRQAMCKEKLPAPGQIAPMDDVYSLERYNATLVRKLEHKNRELHEALRALQASHEHLAELNRRANAELEAFCHSVSRDIRAPLRNIVCLAQVLEDSVRKQLGGEDIRRLTQIAAAGRQMDLLIEGLIEVGRTSQRELLSVELDLEQLLEEALDVVSVEVGTRHIEWHRSRLPTVHGDPTTLRQVLVNLLSNAVKYTRTRAPAVIQIGTRPGRADEVVVFVRDNGIGFDLRQAAGLFALFTRLHTVREFEGLGIGLATVQRIIVRHGGRIWADAAVGRGATFFFSLPTAPGN